jgi:hypothetical protein
VTRGKVDKPNEAVELIQVMAQELTAQIASKDREIQVLKEQTGQSEQQTQELINKSS